MQGEMKSNIIEKYFGWIRYITVEPALWLYYIANQLTFVMQQAFFIHKACRVDHGLSEEICNNLTANATLKAQIQVTTSNFIQWDHIMGQVFPIILALFFGSWSDRRGRKVPLIIALVGRVIYAWMMVVNSLMDTWSLNMVMYTATLPMAMLGNDVVIHACCFSYVADVSSSEQRTLRVTILNILYLIAVPSGIALGWYLFYNVVNSSYTVMFTIHGVLVILAVLYSAVRLKMRTTPQQKPLEKGANPILDFFDEKHVIESVTTLTKPRPGYRRLYLWILPLAMALYTFQRMERSMSYLYTQLTFSWNVATFSQFRTFQSSLFAVAMLIGIPIMSKLLGMRDTLIVVVGALSHASGRIFFVTTATPQFFYAGTAVTALGPVVAPALRSMASKVVPQAERGKVFALLSVFDNAVPLISGPLYTQLYNATLTTAPHSIYWLTFASQIAVLLLIMVIHVTLGSSQLDCEDRANSDVCASEPAKENPSSGSEENHVVPA